MCARERRAVKSVRELASGGRGLPWPNCGPEAWGKGRFRFVACSLCRCPLTHCLRRAQAHVLPGRLGPLIRVCRPGDVLGPRSSVAGRARLCPPSAGCASLSRNHPQARPVGAQAAPLRGAKWMCALSPGHRAAHRPPGCARWRAAETERQSGKMKCLSSSVFTYFHRCNPTFPTASASIARATWCRSTRSPWYVNEAGVNRRVIRHRSAVHAPSTRRDERHIRSDIALNIPCIEY